MDESKLLAKLRNAKSALDAVIRELESKESVDIQPGLATCLYCNKPFAPGERILRQIHMRCYNEIYLAQQEGKVTFEQLEKLGKVGPPGKSGRKRKVRILDQLDLNSQKLKVAEPKVTYKPKETRDQDKDKKE